jgi:hypothetical protein
MKSKKAATEKSESRKQEDVRESNWEKNRKKLSPTKNKKPTPDVDFKGQPHLNRAVQHAQNDNLSNDQFQDNRDEIQQRSPDAVGDIRDTEAVDQ